MICKEIEGFLAMFTLATGVTGLGELQLKMSDQDLCSSFVTESAWPAWGVPLLPTRVLVWILSDSIDSGGRLVSRWRFGFSSPQVCPGEVGSHPRVVTLRFSRPVMR